jgi:hypothetical protein
MGDLVAVCRLVLPALDIVAGLWVEGLVDLLAIDFGRDVFV